MKLLCLLSGGIDSPVAAYLMKKKGHQVRCIHFQVDKSIKSKVKETAKKLGCKLKIKRHRRTLKKIVRNVEPKLTCVICKRAMLARAEKYAKRIGADALLTGDNLGQVASQTSDNLVVETEHIDLPIIRPLIALNKREIISIAKKAGTYELAIKGRAKCPYLPKRPATHADLSAVRKEWKKVF